MYFSVSQGFVLVLFRYLLWVRILEEFGCVILVLDKIYFLVTLGIIESVICIIVLFFGQIVFNDMSRFNKFVLFMKGYCYGYCLVFYNVL